MRKMVLVSMLLAGTSLAYGGEKSTIGATNKDFVTLGEMTSAVPGQPNHTIKQIAESWRFANPTNPDWNGAMGTAVDRQEIIGGDMKSHGYGAAHQPSGDEVYFDWDGTAKIDGQNVTGSGTFQWTGGTGKYKNIKGGGPYTCKFGPNTPNACDWSSQSEY